MDELVTIHATTVLIGYVVFVMGLVKIVVRFQKQTTYSLLWPVIKLITGLSMIVGGFLSAWNR